MLLISSLSYANDIKTDSTPESSLYQNAANYCLVPQIIQILDHNPDINVNDTSFNGLTTTMGVIKKISTLLPEYDSNYNSIIFENCLTIISFLVNHKNYDYRAPLGSSKNDIMYFMSFGQGLTFKQQELYNRVLSILLKPKREVFKDYNYLIPSSQKTDISSALQANAKYGTVEMFCHYLKSAADAPQYLDLNNRSDEQFEKTPLMLAAEAGNFEMVKALIAEGADYYAPLDGDIYATEKLARKNGHLEIAQFIKDIQDSVISLPVSVCRLP